MADHPPTKARALVQDAKAGRRPISELLGEARAIDDPSFAAEALAALAEDDRLDIPTAGRALTDAAAYAADAERPFRRAEAGAEVARRAARWRPGEAEAEVARLRAFATLANTAQGLRGKDLVALAVPLAKAAPSERAAMLKLVIHHGADPVEDAKSVLSAGPGPGVAEAIKQAPEAVQARLLAYYRAHGGELPLAAALAAADRLEPAARREALRAIIAAAARPDLPAIHAALPAEAGERGRLLCALAARADRAADPAQARLWFDEADAAARTLPEGKERDAVLRNVEAGRSRLGGGKPQPKGPDARPAQAAPPRGEGGSSNVGGGTEPTETTGRASVRFVGSVLPSSSHEQPLPLSPPMPAQTAPVISAASKAPPIPTRTATARHVLALVDSYEGALAEPHLRAIGRAAPLCWAFGLDLALVGLPADSIDEVVAKAGRSTGIGEGAGYLEKLAAQGRVALWPREPPAGASGLVVATTPHPDPARAGGFESALRKARSAGLGRLLVLVGLGPKGLPGSWMRAAAVHLELTGDNVSLETATAMGIIAERMRQLPTA